MDQPARHVNSRLPAAARAHARRALVRWIAERLLAQARLANGSSEATKR